MADFSITTTSPNTVAVSFSSDVEATAPDTDAIARVTVNIFLIGIIKRVFIVGLN